MRIVLLLATLLCPALVFAACTPGADPWITLEVIAAEPAPDEPVELIDIDRAGCATLRYASFDRRAGLYRRQLGEPERRALDSELETRAIRRFDVPAVQDAIARREESLRRTLHGSDGERFHVACGDTYRLSLSEAAGSVQIEWVAPKQMAPRYPEVKALTDLVALIESLQKLAAADGKVQVAAVTP